MAKKKGVKKKVRKVSKSEKSIENTEIQIKKAKEYMKKINSQLTNRLHRIDKIKIGLK